MTKDRVWRTHTGQKIEKLYAWVAEEADGGDGIVAAAMPGMPGVTPLIGADRARIESYREMAVRVSSMPGVRAVRLKMFGAGVVIDEIEMTS